LSFSRVSGALVGTADDGRIRILDPTAHRIVVLDSTGAVVGAFGRRGRGPGEFEFPSALSVSPNGEVAVIDLAQRAAVRFTATGEPLALRPISLTPVPNGAMRIRGDSLIYDFRTMEGAMADGRWEVGLLVQSPRDTVTLATVPFPIRETRDVDYGCYASRGEWPLFTPRFQWTIGSDAIAWSGGAEYSVTIHSARRSLRIARSIPRQTTSIEHARRAFPTGQTIRTAEGPCVVPAEQLAEKAGLYPTLPQITALAIDPTGALWVERWSFPDERGVIDVFASDGRYLGTLQGYRIPVAFLDSSRVLFAERDPDTDLRRLRLVRISR
jgi:hypothetical protein